MDKHFPPEMIFKAKGLQVKRAFVLDIAKDGPADCANCGGQGYLYLFLATEGPYQTAGSPYSRISKWFDNAWWCAPVDGEYGTVSFLCPDCKGTGKHGYVT